MFNLDESIAEWRRQMGASGAKRPELLDELESHLRDDIDCRKSSGCDSRRAFEAAIAQMGRAEELNGEFKKLTRPSESIQDIILTLAGIYQPVLSTTMTATPASLEPRWASYSKALLFLIPAVAAWGFSLAFLMPKVQHFSAQAGFAGFKLLHALTYLSHQWYWTLGVIVTGLALLEWRSAKWPRYRKAALGTGAFVINTLVLVAIILMVIAVILSAPAVAKG